MNRLDRGALRRALALLRAESGRATQIAAMLESEPWQEVGAFAAFCCQCDSLGLKPWQSPPMYAELSPDQPDAMALLLRLLGAGLSRYEPDPVAALAQVRSGAPCRQS